MSSVSCCALRAARKKAWSAPPLGLVRETSSQHQPTPTRTLGQHRAHQGSAAPRRAGLTLHWAGFVPPKLRRTRESKTAPRARLTASEPINTPTTTFAPQKFAVAPWRARPKCSSRRSQARLFRHGRTVHSHPRRGDECYVLGFIRKTKELRPPRRQRRFIDRAL